MTTMNAVLILVLAIVIIAWIITICSLRRKLKAIEGMNGVEKKEEGDSITIHL